MVRRRLYLDGTWQFDLMRAAPDELSSINPSKPIVVPSCAEEFFPEITQDQYYLFYRKSFVFSIRKARRYFLHFVASDYITRVYLNGSFLGEHEGGFTPFEFDVTGHITERNTVDVVVFDPIADDNTINPREIPHGKQNGIPNWYTNISGIWQSVFIEERPPFYIVDATINTSARDRTLSSTAQTIGEVEEVVLTLKKEGARIATQRMQPGEMINLKLDEVVPWSLDSPVLYDVELSALCGNTQDTIKYRVGFKDLEIRDGKLFLNDEEFYVKGVLDQDFYPDTLYRAPSREYLERSFRMLKEMGFNLLRCHVKLPEPVYMELADEIGFLVWCDAPYCDKFSEISAKRLKDTIFESLKRDKNHVSLSIYSLINESWGIDLEVESQVSWLLQLFKDVKSKFPKIMLVDNSACHGNHHALSDINDYHFYASSVDRKAYWNALLDNYCECPESKYLKPYRQNYNNEPLIVSEFGNWSLPPEKWFSLNIKPYWFSNSFSQTDATLPDEALSRFQASEISKELTLEQFIDLSQAFQLENLRIEVQEIKKRPRIRGYVVTEFTDVFWETNGLLDFDRNWKHTPEEIRQLTHLEEIVLDSVDFPVIAGSHGVTARFFTVGDSELSDNVSFLLNGSELPRSALSGVCRNEEEHIYRADLVTGSLRPGCHKLAAILGCQQRPAGSTWFLVTPSNPGRPEITTELSKDLLERITTGGVAFLRLEKGATFSLGEYSASVLEKDGFLSGDWVAGFPWVSNELEELFPRNTYNEAHERLISGTPLLDSKGFDRRVSGIAYGWFGAFFGYIDMLRIGKGKLFVTTLNLDAEDSLSQYLCSLLRTLDFQVHT